MYPESFQKLINQFSSLPGIGPKMAERLVLSLFKQDTGKITEFSDALLNLHSVKPCKTCFNISQDDLCTICSNTYRDKSKLCIVEESLNILPLERSQAFDGMYHVLGGTIKKRGGNKLTLPELINRVETENFTEIIIATNFTTEGDMTAMHIKQELSSYDILISRLVRGLATGSDIEYADDMTIRSSITNRGKFS
ncbi:MAG: recombination mediator RecR [Candidatus Moraniibacteriota bacterium]|jgi:recombination protein RecR